MNRKASVSTSSRAKANKVTTEKHEAMDMQKNKGPVCYAILIYDAKVSARSRLYLLKTIASKLAFKPERYKKFKSTVFGPWLDIRTQEHANHLINYLLQHQRNVKDPSTDIPFIFDIGPNTIEFGRREFCLVTGFLFGDCSLDQLKVVNSCFRESVFLENSCVKGLDLNKLLNNHIEFNKLLDDDVVRVCLLLALEFVFMGFELRHVVANGLLGLVDNLSTWNDFPWGEYMWIELHKKDFGSLTENPHNHVSLMMKITDIEVEFQIRITSIEDFLKIHRSPNLEKPSCGSDVKAGNKESMCVDSSVKVVEQNEFDRNVADKNLIHDFDHKITALNLEVDE
nr:phospholipase-like protein [Tanacetum cinerariifolium]